MKNLNTHAALSSALIAAAERRDLDEVKRAVESGAPIDALESAIGGVPSWLAGGALHWAAANGDEPMIKYLIAQGANLELAAAAGKTPLLLAAEVLSVAGVRELLVAGANPNAAGGIGETPLHVVAWQMSGEGSVTSAAATTTYDKANSIARMLFEHGANGELRTHAGFSVYETHNPSVGLALRRLREATASR